MAIRMLTFKTHISFQEENWVWIRTNEKINYNAWDTGEPNDDLNMADEDCLYLIFDGTIRYSSLLVYKASKQGKKSYTYLTTFFMST